MNINDMALRAYRKALDGVDTTRFNGGFCVYMDDDEATMPEPFSIIYDGDLTAITWDDGSVTRTHRKDSDEYDAVFGTLACILRKLTNNHGHGVDEHEEALRGIASAIKSEEDVEDLIEHYSLMTDVLVVLSESKDKWLDQLGPAEERPESSPTFRLDDSAITMGHVVSDRTTELEERLDQLTREREAMRQTIRDLVDKGEL